MARTLTYRQPGPSWTQSRPRRHPGEYLRCIGCQLAPSLALRATYADILGGFDDFQAVAWDVGAFGGGDERGRRWLLSEKVADDDDQGSRWNAVMKIFVSASAGLLIRTLGLVLLGPSR